MNHANASHELSLSVKLTIYAFRISDSICFQSNWLKLFYLIYRDNFSQTCKCKLHVRSTSQRLFQERELISFKKTNPSSVAATATGTSLNKIIHEQNNGSARAL